MRIEKVKKKSLIVLIIAVFIGIFVFVLNTSYAFFTTQANSKNYIAYTGTLQVDFAQTSNAINIPDAMPMTNSDGISAENNSYSFTVTNNGTMDAKYQVRLEVASDNEKEYVPLEYIKIAYSYNGGWYSNPVRLSDLDSTLVFVEPTQLAATNTDSYTIKLWVDYSAPNEVSGKKFKAKIAVDAVQDLGGDSMSTDTAPIIVLNKDNGNIDMIIATGTEFTDPGILNINDDKDILDKDNVVKSYKYFDGENFSTVNGIDTSINGMYFITYTVTDSANNISRVERIVTVNNGAAPTISLVGDSTMNINQYSTFTDPGATLDSGSSNSKMVTLGKVDTTKPGTYNLTYVAINTTTNNMNHVSRTVNVAEVQTYILKDKILADNTVITANPTLGTLTSTSNEHGLFKKSVTNGFGGIDGDTYYFRGDVDNNVVEFAGFTWRIIRINEDGTIRLILDEGLKNESDIYKIYDFYDNAVDTYEYMYYSNSTTIGNEETPNVKYSVDKWYQENITNKGYDVKVASGDYFCEAAKVVENTEWKTAEGTTFMQRRADYTPTFSCMADPNGHQYVTGKVGLITYDEAAYAGAVSYITGNSDYYLRKNADGDVVEDTFWTMSPAGINTNDNNILYDWAINYTYDLTPYYVDYELHLRPVLNLKSNTVVTIDENDHYVVR